MHDPLVVQVFQARQDLPHKVLDERFLKGAVVAEECRDRATGDVFEENVEVFLVRGGIYAESARALLKKT
jgi:hypothetical protein